MPCVLAIGNFDGLHRGHQALLQELVRIAQHRSLRASVLSFYPHPAVVLKKNATEENTEENTEEKIVLPPLVSLRERRQILSRIGVQEYLLMPFTKELAQMQAQDFLREIFLKRLQGQALLVGEDFRLGAGRAWGIEEIKGFLDSCAKTLQVFPFLRDERGEGGQKLGSRFIRDALGQGDCEGAARALGRSFLVQGRVIRGAARGSKLGFPTANLGAIKTFLPACGVYPAFALLGGERLPCVVNVGRRPSFETEGRIQVEAHLIGQNRQCYGRRISLEFFNRIREEQKFHSADELISQIKKDIEVARQRLAWEALRFERDDPERLDVFMAEVLRCEDGRPLLTRSKAQALIAEGAVLVNGERKAKHCRLRKGDLIELRGGHVLGEQRDTVASSDTFAWDFPVSVVYEDEDILVVNKPAGLSVHPGAGNTRHTLLNALIHRGSFEKGSFEKSGKFPAQPERLGIVHRLDKDTTGLLVVARNDFALAQLARQFERKTAGRSYLGLAQSTPRQKGVFNTAEQGSIDLPLGRDPHHRLRQAVRSSGGRKAITHWKVIERYPHALLMRFELETGRTHQIRVHLAHQGHALIGDPLYGRPRKLPKELELAEEKFARQALHAEVLRFTHPRSGEVMEFHAPIPEDFETLRKAFSERE